MTPSELARKYAPAEKSELAQKYSPEDRDFPRKAPVYRGGMLAPTLKTAGAVVGGAAAFPLAGLGAYGVFVAKGPEAAERVYNKLLEAPAKLLNLGEKEQEILSAIGLPFEKLHEAGNWIQEQFEDSPTLGATLATAFEFGAMMLGPAWAKKVVGRLQKGDKIGAAAELRRVHEERLEGLRAKPPRLKELAKREAALRGPESFEDLAKLESYIRTRVAEGKLPVGQIRGFLKKLQKAAPEPPPAEPHPLYGRVIKQRTLKKSDGTELKFPKVYLGELSILQKMPDLPPTFVGLGGELKWTPATFSSAGSGLWKTRPLGGLIEPMISVFDRLGPKAKELIYRPVKQAEFNIAVDNKRLQSFIKDVRKKYSAKERERIGLWAVAQQKRGKQILKIMGRKVEQLTPREKQLYKELRGRFDLYWERLNSARKASGKAPLPKVRNYFTFMRTLDYMDKLGINPVEASAKSFAKHLDAVKSMYGIPTTAKFPFEIPRLKAAGLSVELDVARVFERYGEAANRYIHLSPVLTKIHELTGTSIVDPKTGKRWRLSETHPNAYEAITKWRTFLANASDMSFLGKAPPLVERAARTLNRNLTYAVLSANVRSALIQPTAFVNTFTQIGSRYGFEGAYSLFSPQKRKFVLQNSKVLLPRQYDVAVREAMQAVKSGRVGEAKKLTARVALKPLQMLDMETATATWYGGYKYAKEALGLSHKRAANWADDLVTRTQASGAMSDIAPIQRSALGRSASLFQTFIIQNWNLLTRDILGLNNPRISRATAMRRVARLIMGTTLVNMLYEDVLGLNSPFPTPLRVYQEMVDEGAPPQERLVRIIKELSEYVPIIGGGLRYGSHPLGAPFQFAGEVSEALSGEPLAPGIPELAAKGAGIPGTQALIKYKKIRQRGGTIPEAIIGKFPKKSLREALKALPPPTAGKALRRLK